jgi:hypothetical protein
MFDEPPTGASGEGVTAGQAARRPTSAGWQDGRAARRQNGGRAAYAACGAMEAAALAAVALAFCCCGSSRRGGVQIGRRSRPRRTATFAPITIVRDQDAIIKAGSTERATEGGQGTGIGLAAPFKPVRRDAPHIANVDATDICGSRPRPRQVVRHAACANAPCGARSIRQLRRADQQS